MTIEDAIAILEEFNKWRRGQGMYGLIGSTCPVTPMRIGEAIDLAIKLLKEKEASNEF